MLNSSPWLFNEQKFYNDAITSSLRFPQVGGGGYLSRTFSNNNTSNDWTFSTWIKRSSITTWSAIFYSSSTGNPYYQSGLTFEGADKLRYYHGSNQNSGANLANNTISTARFRDTSAWYHIVVQRDNDGNTVLYVNNEQVASAASSSSLRFINGTSYPHYIGNYTYQSNPGGIFHGYMAETIFVDGSLISPTDLGETKKGVWIPLKDPEITYGANGFRLQYLQTGTSQDANGIGADTSGNNNHFAVTSLQAHDVVSDSPENNFATLNSTIRPYTVTPAETVSDGNLNAFFNSSAVSGSYWSTFLLTSGKWYFEVLIDAVGSNANVGISNNPDASGRGTFTAPANGYGYFYKMTGEKGINNTFSSYGATYTTNDIIGCAFDLDNNTITFYKNNVSQGQITGVAPYDANNRGFIPAMTGINGVRSIINFGQDSSFAGNETAQGNTDGNSIGDFYYAPPSGYLALCTSNLPEPTISPNGSTQADDYFNTVLYTGNGGTQSITGVGFQPDWTWIKGRSYAGYNYLVDSVRGYTERLFSNLSDGASVEANTVASADSDGFTLGSDPGVNTNTSTYVSWNWKANGSPVINTDGTITSQVSANTNAGFSIVSYTGSTSESVGHGLGVAPKAIFVKDRDATSNWAVYHQGVQDTTANGFLELNTTTAVQTGSNPRFLSGTAGTSQPTSTVFYVNNYSGSSTNNTGNDYISYCFAEIESYSKFGSYTGNGSSNGTFVYTGFRPAFVMMKNTTTSGNSWVIQDKARSTYNEVNAYLLANDSGAEGTGVPLDFLSNGFKMTSASQNDSGANFIYMAFAENPFKYSTAR